ncbi:hypothetical protein V7068_19380 [Bacillus sp. JJ634]
MYSVDNTETQIGDVQKCLFGAEATVINERINFLYKVPYGAINSTLIIKASGKEFVMKISELNIYDVTL